MRLRRSLVLVLVAIVLIAPSLQARAAPGSLDRSFGDDGRVSTDFSPMLDIAAAVAIQADRKIVAVGSVGESNEFGLSRYNRDGTLDPSFGGDGKVSTDFTPNEFDAASDVAVQPDGNLVVVGGSSGFFGGSNAVWTLARYLPDGSLDPAFGSGGQATIDFDPDPGVSEFGTGVALDAGGKIVVVGTLDTKRFALARYNADGTPDSSFDDDGMVTTDVAAGDEEPTDVVVQADGSIVVVGHIKFNRFALARYTTDGTLDPSFGGDGTITTNFRRKGAEAAEGVVIQPNGRIIAAGEAKGKFALARYTVNGTLDPSFSGNGRLTTGFTSLGDSALGVSLDPDGKIVAAGAAFFSFAVARYRRSGRLDASFGDGGKVITKFGRDGARALGLAIQIDGRVVAAGFASIRGGRDSKFAVVRYRGI